MLEEYSYVERWMFRYINKENWTDAIKWFSEDDAKAELLKIYSSIRDNMIEDGNRKLVMEIDALFR